MPTPPDTDQSSNASPTCTVANNARQASPAPSSSTLTSVDIAGSAAGDIAGNAMSNATANSASATRPAKRRKLTSAEKEQQKREKEAKDAEKAVQRAKREEEKRVKDEEKRKKAEERDAKKREKEVEDERKNQEKLKKAEDRDAKKREKDAEEERKNQERLKKERSQMRLGVWFQKPATPAKEDGEDDVHMSSARRKSLSLEPFDAVVDQIRQSQSPCKGSARPVTQANTPAKPAVSDYAKYFLPFQLKSNCYMAPGRTSEDAHAAQEAFDHDTTDPSLQEKYDLGLVSSYASLERQFAAETDFIRGQPLPSTRNLVEQIQGTLHEPIDLTEDKTPPNPIAALQRVSLRYLEFGIDVRPPYFGTYSKIRSPRTAAKLRRNPFVRARKDTDYDYDSEAEWEEPEEGDDECNDDEDEAESQGDADEMDEFLDDEDDAVKSKRKMLTGDLVPTSTGLCWETRSGGLAESASTEASSRLLRDMRIGVLLPDFSEATIDPFSTKYWDTPTVEIKAAPAKVPESTATSNTSLMPPPRGPLQPLANTNSTLDHHLIGAAEGMKGPISSASATQSSRGRPKATPKSLSKEDLDEFKDAVVGSQLSKADLLKGLKARRVVLNHDCGCQSLTIGRFPKLTNDLIKSSLGEHFAQIGATKADKKWVFVSVA